MHKRYCSENDGCRWLFYCDAGGKRNAKRIILEAIAKRYPICATIRYEIAHTQHKFSDWVTRENLDIVGDAIDFAVSDIRIYDMSDKLT